MTLFHALKSPPAAHRSKLFASARDTIMQRRPWGWGRRLKGTARLGVAEPPSLALVPPYARPRHGTAQAPPTQGEWDSRGPYAWRVCRVVVDK
jgi:hypothetical protein